MRSLPSSGLPTPESDSDRRRFRRYNVALDLAFGPITAPGVFPTVVEHTIIINMSLGGLCLFTDILYPIGTAMGCRITLPGRLEPLEVEGAVVWFQRLERDAHSYKLGVEFTRVSPKVQEALTALFNQPAVMEHSRSKRLLLVEDDAELQLAMKLRFESTGFDVITASDGLEALRKGREEHPHLIILDLMLPQLNGYEVCRLLKFDQKFQHIPIILCTARCRREDRDLGLTAGADAYITKPFRGEELIAKIEELLTAQPS